MILPEGVPVANCDKSDALVLHVSVQMALHVNADCASALVQNSVFRLVVN